MKYLLTVFFIFDLFANIVARPISCQTIINKRDNRVSFYCTGLTNLVKLEKAWANSTSIEISDSNIPNIPGHSFARFGATLVTLDLHGSGIQTIDFLAFVGLTKLENLLLWGNKLIYVYKDWFIYMSNLKTLDLSFNSIQVMDYALFEVLPNLRNFYFDYNEIRYIDFSMFANLRNLKNVKFEKNPWNWGFRARLTWQLENQHVKYGEDWEDWAWMNHVIKECVENGYGEIPNDVILDCVVEKLLNYTYEIFTTGIVYENLECSKRARQLVRCMRPKNATGNTDNETARRILEYYTAVLPTMSRSHSRFTMSWNGST
ncbi:PREDICTED: leucine-rich repeat transmembrane neuronal protein 2-like [Eufriesea mexicana]|uniref:leucine-rich repeat transmembrane neuronal protein 2-like n=1 Tax=Eufriesea mexicana TaxID=516756 RepID=UPI00083C79FC|nr:PREDICTED: leucine-rich repeat transmembrane neuronal protein 2-like [Eufriesea mexicana]